MVHCYWQVEVVRAHFVLQVLTYKLLQTIFEILNRTVVAFTHFRWNCLWGGIAAGIFGLEALGGMGGVSFMSQLLGSLAGIGVALIGGYITYSVIDKIVGIRLDEESEFNGADLSIHKIGANTYD